MYDENNNEFWCEHFESLVTFVSDVLLDSLLYTKYLSRPSLKKSFSILA